VYILANFSGGPAGNATRHGARSPSQHRGWHHFARAVGGDHQLPFNIAPALLKCALPPPSFWTPIINSALRMLHAQNPAAGLAAMRALCDAAAVSFDDWFPG
jgi:hypothetical protein